MRSLVRYLLTLFLSLLFAFVTVEIILRVAPGMISPKVLLHFEPALRSTLAEGRFSTRNDVRPVERDDGGPDLWVYKPYKVKHYNFSDYGAVRLVHLDEMGFCNAPGRYQATPTSNLITIGDSFTWCHAIHLEDSWAFQLGRRSGLSLYNLGRGGLGLFEEVQMLKLFGVERSPEVVVMNVYEGNDLRDAARFHAYRSGNRGTPLPDPERQNGRAPPPFLNRHSYAFNFVVGGFTALQSTISRSWQEARIDFSYQLVSAEHAIPFNPSVDQDEVRYARRLRAGEVSLALFSEALASFVALSQTHGFIPVVSYSPSAHTVYQDHIEFADPSLAELLDWFSKEQRAFFTAQAKRLGFTFVDLTPALQAAAAQVHPERLLYYPTSLHYTARAHAVVAAVLAAKLRELDLARPALSVSKE